jgi:hypothetical protein
VYRYAAGKSTAGSCILMMVLNGDQLQQCQHAAADRGTRWSPTHQLATHLMPAAAKGLLLPGSMNVHQKPLGSAAGE